MHCAAIRHTLSRTHTTNPAHTAACRPLPNLLPTITSPHTTHHTTSFCALEVGANSTPTPLTYLLTVQLSTHYNLHFTPLHISFLNRSSVLSFFIVDFASTTYPDTARLFLIRKVALFSHRQFFRYSTSIEVLLALKTLTCSLCRILNYFLCLNSTTLLYCQTSRFDYLRSTKTISPDDLEDATGT